MPLPARNTLAIVGAGPIGLEAASAALDHGLDVHVFERGEVGAHPIAWGHVRMFTPWRANLGPSGAARLERAGWAPPAPDEHPTGLELTERYLEPLAALPDLAPRIHRHSQVVHVGRSGFLKHDTADAEQRRKQPFRLLVRDAGGRENFLHAFHLIDASGVYGRPNWAGDGGIPARGELYLAPQMSYHVDDVLGLRRVRYAGKRTLVIGGGSSGATVVADLATLAEQEPGTSVAWATRETLDQLGAGAADPLPLRRELFERARALAAGESPVVTHHGGIRVEGFEFNSATHRYRTALFAGDAAHVEESDQVLVATGFGPDESLYRELQASASATTSGEGPGATADTADLLAHPEPDFWILGHKSFGRNPDFLLEAGYRQVAAVIARIAERMREAART